MAKITVEFDVPDAAAVGLVASLGGAVVSADTTQVPKAAPAAPKAAAPAAPAAPPAAPKAPPPPKAAAPKAPPPPAAPAPAPAGPSPEDAAADEEALAAGWTLEHVQNQAKEFSQANGAAALGPILAEYGLKKIKESSPRQWGALYAAFGGGA